MNHVGGLPHHISNRKSFEKCFLSENPRIGVNNGLIFTSLILSLLGVVVVDTTSDAGHAGLASSADFFSFLSVAFCCCCLFVCFSSNVIV